MILLVYVSPCHFNDYPSLRINLPKTSDKCPFKKTQRSDKNSGGKHIKTKDINTCIKYKWSIIKVVGVILIDPYYKSQKYDLHGKLRKLFEIKLEIKCLFLKLLNLYFSFFNPNKEKRTGI